ncbi:TMIG1 protein, partial [Indicator maculatus]|nr:TMIG1 protein [Indicator maculatus]
MVQRSSLAVPYQAPVLAVCFLAGVATGLELSVNNHAADFALSTFLAPAVSLSCLVQNSSQAEELLWYRGDGQVDLRDGNKVNISNICISPVTESDNGVTFSCRLARDKSVQVSVVLNVLFAPHLGGEESFQIEENKDVTMSCNTKANPQVQAAWYKDNTTLILPQDRYQLYHTSEVTELTIQNVQKSDNGTYTCMVESSMGNRRKDFHLIVEDKRPVFPTEAVIAAAVVVTLTILFAVVARRDKIFKVWKAFCCSAL